MLHYAHMITHSQMRTLHKAATAELHVCETRADFNISTLYICYTTLLLLTIFFLCK
jgi:hypothetical protein